MNVQSVSVTPVRLQPGDQVIVRVFQPVGEDELKRIRRTVQKWAGEGVRVLVVDCLKHDVSIVRSPEVL